MMEDKKKEDRTSKLLVIVAIVLLGVGSIQFLLRFPKEYKIVFLYKLDIEFKEGRTGDLIFFLIPLNTTQQIVRILKKTENIVLVNSTHIGFLLNRVGSKGSIVMRVEVKKRAYPYPLAMYKRSNISRELMRFIGRPCTSITVLLREIETKIPGIANESDVMKAYLLAKFLRDHFTYSASGLPRDIEYVLTNRIGDCDDLSAVLIELLWSYRIPAQIEYSYILAPGSMETYKIGNSTLTRVGFIGHAYVLAYLGNLKWLPIDITYCMYDNPFMGSTYIAYGIVVSRRARPLTSEDIESMLKPLRERNIVVYEELVLLSPVRLIYRYARYAP
ncbi:MAG: hypothetical protein DRJ49_05550 [Thermoprotei archaeon]|nr:MAG: hypothetical protein DRJ49_05550 [Thermoprotei archaeon]